MLPMYQSEALWISFGRGACPMAVKVAAGNVCAIAGEPFTNELDGFAVEKGLIRQFVAMPSAAATRPSNSSQERPSGAGSRSW
jgi:hypothetical protein